MARWLTIAFLPFIASPALSASEFLGKNRLEWARDLTSPDASVRRSAAFALGKLGSYAASSVPQLAARLKDDSSSVREMAAHALGEIAKQSLLDARSVWEFAGQDLKKLLDPAVGSSDKLRRSAVYALGCCNRFIDDPARDLIVQALAKDTSPIVRQNAAWALGHIGDARADKVSITALCDVLERRDELATVQRDAARALEKIGRPLAQPGIRSLLTLVEGHPNEIVLKPALNALANLIDPSDNIKAKGLEPLLKHDDFEVRLAAAFVMANTGGDLEQVLPVLLKELRNGNASTREMVIAALANVGPRAAPAVDDLIKILNDRKNTDNVRRNAAVALSRIGRAASAAVDALALTLDPRQKEHVEVRLFSAEALVTIGHPANISAKDQMLKTLKDTQEHPHVRLRMVWMLMAVEDLKRYGALEALIATLSEKDFASKDVRYNAAILLGRRLRTDTPEKAIDVLEEILRDDRFKIYDKAEAKVSGGGEGSKGGSDVKAKFGRDARYVAAEALARIGKKASRPDVLKSLKALKMADDERCRKAAEDALAVLDR